MLFAWQLYITINILIFIYTREIKFAMYMALGTHWTACGWFLIACSSLSIGAMDPHTCNVGSWALKFSDVPLSKSRPCTYLLL